MQVNIDTKVGHTHTHSQCHKHACVYFEGNRKYSNGQGEAKVISEARRGEITHILSVYVCVCEGERLIIVLCPRSPSLSPFAASLLLRRVKQINATCNMKMPHALRFSRRVLSVTGSATPINANYTRHIANVCLDLLISKSFNLHSSPDEKRLKAEIEAAKNSQK